MARKKKAAQAAASTNKFTEKQQAGIKDFSSLLKQNKTVLQEFRDDMANQFSAEYSKMKPTKPYLNKADIQAIGVAAANQAILNLETLGEVQPVEEAPAEESEQEETAEAE